MPCPYCGVRYGHSAKLKQLKAGRSVPVSAKDLRQIACHPENPIQNSIPDRLNAGFSGVGQGPLAQVVVFSVASSSILWMYFWMEEYVAQRGKDPVCQASLAVAWR